MAQQLLHSVTISTENPFPDQVSYQIFGQPLGQAPICLVNHALTGNSEVCGENGWWKSLISEGNCIDTNKYTILAFNIPGNGFDGVFIDNYKEYSVPLVADFFVKALTKLNIHKLHSIIGGSLGAAIGWQMLLKKPDLAEHFIPIGSDWKTTDWIYAFCQTQHQILTVAVNGVAEARKHAMMFYRAPQSFANRFNNEIDEEKQIRKSADWLNYHGRALDIRFSKRAYFLMNHLLTRIHDKPITPSTYKQLAEIEAEIILIAMDSDFLFPAFEMKETYKAIKKWKKNITYNEIHTPHGHDGFLIEYEQLSNIIKPVFE